MLRGLVVTIISTDTEQLTAAIGRWMQTIVARFRRVAEQKGIKQTAHDLSHPELYGLLNGHIASVGVEERLNEIDGSLEHAETTQAYLPIGPSCC